MHPLLDGTGEDDGITPIDTPSPTRARTNDRFVLSAGRAIVYGGWPFRPNLDTNDHA